MVSISQNKILREHISTNTETDSEIPLANNTNTINNSLTYITLVSFLDPLLNLFRFLHITNPVRTIKLHYIVISLLLYKHIAFIRYRNSSMSMNLAPNALHYSQGRGGMDPKKLGVVS